MIHPQDFEQRLGFDKIREKLKSLCTAEPGRRAVEAIVFLTDYQQLMLKLRQANETLVLHQTGQLFSTAGFLDDEPLNKVLAVEGSYLEGSDLLQLARLLEVLIHNRNFIAARSESLPALSELIHGFQPDRKLPAMIMHVIDEQGEVRTHASERLAEIRKQLTGMQQRLRDIVQRVFRHAVSQGWVPEGAQPTVRNGRPAIPVLAAYKRMVSGFIQDESATGQTVFIEPAEAIETANLMRELELAERREVIRLLTELTRALRQEWSLLQKAFAFMQQLDVLKAKALLADELNACLPEVVNRPGMHWHGARHPGLYYALRDKRKVVPLDIHLTETHRALLISGPNAGGKSVCLKTTGLLQYMLQCGLLVPVSPDSQFGLFQDILVDIGDQQSIENDLSTYSSHLQNMALFVRQAGPASLVLIDELGSGTDPAFGGPIAQAVLHALVKKQAWCIATTHYHNLKTFASHTEGIRNGSMRFDEVTLRPTYVLDIGKPGSSFAMEIAERTGIPTEVLQEARQLAGTGLMDFDKLLRDLQNRQAELEQLLATTRAEARRLSEEQQQLDRDRQELEARRQNILDQARAEARRLVAEANREIEKTIRHIRENQAHKAETRKMRQRLKQLTQQLDTPPQLPAKKQLPIMPGDVVRLEGQQAAGEVLETDGKTAIVQFGAMKTKTEVHKLEKLSQRPAALKPTTAAPLASLAEKRARFQSVLDIRGKRVEEAIPMLEEFIDTALLLGCAELQILHGKGEGILRKAVRDKLKQYPQVASVADAHVERGGAGITVVVLK
jgi:DNA mismatch repair protein MutS2